MIETVYHIEGVSTSSHGRKGVTSYRPKAMGLNGPKAKKVKVRGSKAPGLWAILFGQLSSTLQSQFSPKMKSGNNWN